MIKKFISKMTPADQPQTAALFADVYNECFRANLSQPMPDFEAVTAGEVIYTAKIDGTVVGFASLWEPTNFIHFLFVKKEYRGAGVGSALVGALAAQYGVPMTLKCLKRNTHALHFYEKTGWRTLEEGTSADGGFVLLELKERMSADDNSA